MSSDYFVNLEKYVLINSFTPPLFNCTTVRFKPHLLYCDWSVHKRLMNMRPGSAPEFILPKQRRETGVAITHAAKRKGKEGRAEKKAGVQVGNAENCYKSKMLVKAEAKHLAAGGHSKSIDELLICSPPLA